MLALYGHVWKLTADLVMIPFGKTGVLKRIFRKHIFVVVVFLVEGGGGIADYVFAGDSNYIYCVLLHGPSC